jgi:polyhydroxyalkanoate synthase
MTSTSLDRAASPEATMREAAQQLDQTLHSLMAKSNMGLSPIAMTLAYMDWAMHLGSSPGQQMIHAQQSMADLQHKLQSSGEETDTRFRDASWQHWPYNALKESYKTQADHWMRSTQVEGMSDHHRHMVSFFTRQWLDALSPSNWPLSNPEVMRKAMETQGESLQKGWSHYKADMLQARGAEGANAAELDQPLPFVVGQDVATTPGKVVFRNRLVELIQYTPTTEKVHAEPVLIVPSCIMKYYILDLSPHNSMVRYLVGQGHTVFMISWRNPDASDRDLGLDDYLRMGVMEAMAAVKKQTSEPRLHAMGYCLGGTFLSIVAAVLGRKSSQRGRRTGADMPALASVTLLAAQTDFSEPGELGLFIDDDQLKTLREDMAQKGYLSGKQMAGAFQFLNARDLIWSRSTHRYLLGEEEVGMDMMSWNADLTRLPERMHNEYLTRLFLHDALAKGHYQFEGEGLALMDIKAPMLVVGTVRDHVSPWRSVYKIHLTTDTDTTFILAAGGHNAGIVSEPGHAKRNYQMHHVSPGYTWIEPEAWVKKASLHEGSWWVPMQDWLAKHSGPLVKARPIPAKNALCDAPGDYVKVRYAD